MCAPLFLSVLYVCTFVLTGLRLIGPGNTWKAQETFSEAETCREPRRDCLFMESPYMDPRNVTLRSATATTDTLDTSKEGGEGGLEDSLLVEQLYNLRNIHVGVSTIGYP